MKVICSLILINLIYGTYGGPIVQTTYGKIEGNTTTSRLKKTIYSFRGIRYAKPPLGELRFQAPEPPDSWEGVINATNDAPACPQFGDEIPTNEDCLYLNVYTTDLSNSSNKPVFVFFHPGAWLFFYGRSDLFGAEYMLDRDVVLVTSNYRLGVLGFLSSGDEILPGNQGLKDQVAVLRWVRDNIASFGGDPEKVTLGGYSVGGYSATLHLVSPMSQGLFKQAIAMSGAAVVDFTLTRNPQEIFMKQAELLNCSINVTSEEIISCLRTKSPKEIIDSSTGFTKWNDDPLIWIGPVVEKERNDGSERFLVEEPIQSYISGRFAKNIPVIIGHNLNEFDYAGYYLVMNDTIIKDLNENSNYVYPIFLMYENNSNKDIITSRLKEFYFNNEPISKDSATPLGHMYSDDTVNFPAYRATKLLIEHSEAPIYSYHFTFQGRYSWRYGPDNSTPLGVVHHDDLMYLFYMSKFPFFQENDPETKMVDTYTTLFSNFFFYGNPNGEGPNIWAPITKDNPQYLEIGNQSLEMHKGWLNEKRMKFWDEIFPLP